MLDGQAPIILIFTFIHLHLNSYYLMAKLRKVKITNNSFKVVRSSAKQGSTPKVKRAKKR